MVAMKKIRKGTIVESGTTKGRYLGETVLNGKRFAQIANAWSKFGSSTLVLPETVRVVPASSDNSKAQERDSVS